MKSYRVLIVSDAPLFTDAISRLLEADGIQVVAKAESLPEARSILNAQEIDAVVVDYDDTRLKDIEVMPQLVNCQEKCQVIFLTMTNNQMIVHHRERVKNVTPTDLIEAVRFSRQT